MPDGGGEIRRGTGNQSSKWGEFFFLFFHLYAMYMYNTCTPRVSGVLFDDGPYMYMPLPPPLIPYSLVYPCVDPIDNLTSSNRGPIPATEFHQEKRLDLIVPRSLVIKRKS